MKKYYVVEWIENIEHVKTILQRGQIMMNYQDKI